MSTLGHKCQSARSQVVCELCMTFWREKSVYAAWQKCILHKLSLVCRSMEILLPYSLCAITSSHQNSDVQIWNATSRNHPKLLFETLLEFQHCHFLLLLQWTTYSLLFALNAAYVLSGTILNGNKRFLVIGTLVISWFLGCISLIT